MSCSLPVIFLFLLCVLPSRSFYLGRSDGAHLNIIEYICPDPNLKQIAVDGVTMYSTTEEINNYIAQKVDGYNNQMWSVTVVNFSRVTGDLLPGGTTSQNLCFISVDKENIVVIMAAIAQQLK
ncbi:unnamed protein product [Auanema sp. JU1783]|nr:unnamed protein product [Auanema sp. JU1783]